MSTSNTPGGKGVGVTLLGGSNTDPIWQVVSWAHYRFVNVYALYKLTYTLLLQ